jgi:hypothetical protein
MAATTAAAWRAAVDAHVVGASRDAVGLTSFPARSLVTWLVSVGRVASRAEATLLAEVLRARDVIRPLAGEDRFEDTTARWRCRSGEPPSAATMFTVAALLNAPGNYVLGAAFLKQGAVFVNPRYFVLDRTTCRLYVFTDHHGVAPRYYLDFAAKPGCTVSLIAPPGSLAALRARREERRQLRLRRAGRRGRDAGYVPAVSGSGGGGDRGERGGGGSASSAASVASYSSASSPSRAARMLAAASAAVGSSNNSVTGSDDGASIGGDFLLPASSGAASDAGSVYGGGGSVVAQPASQLYGGPLPEDDADSDSDTDDDKWFGRDADSDDELDAALLSEDAGGGGGSPLRRRGAPGGASAPLADPLTRSARLPAGANSKAFGVSISGPGGVRITAYCLSLRRAYVWWRELSAAAGGGEPKHLLSHTQQQLRAVDITPPKPAALVTAGSAASLLSSSSFRSLPGAGPASQFAREPARAFAAGGSSPAASGSPAAARAPSRSAAQARPGSMLQQAAGESAADVLAASPMSPSSAGASSVGGSPLSPTSSTPVGSPLPPDRRRLEFAGAADPSGSDAPADEGAPPPLSPNVPATNSASDAASGSASVIRDIAAIRRAKWLKEHPLLAPQPEPAVPAPPPPPPAGGGAGGRSGGVASLLTAVRQMAQDALAAAVGTSASPGGGAAFTSSSEAGDGDDDDDGSIPVPTTVAELLEVPSDLIAQILEDRLQAAEAAAAAAGAGLGEGGGDGGSVLPRPRAPGTPSHIAAAPAAGSAASPLASPAAATARSAASSAGALLVPGNDVNASVALGDGGIRAALQPPELPAAAPPLPDVISELYAEPLQLLVQVAGSGDVRTLRLLALEPHRLLTDVGVFVPSHQQYILDRCYALLPPLPVEVAAAGPPGGGSSSPDDEDADDAGSRLSVTPLQRIRQASAGSQTPSPRSQGALSREHSLASMSLGREASQASLGGDAPAAVDLRPVYDAQRALLQLSVASAFQTYQDALEGDEEELMEERAAAAQAQLLAAAAAAAAAGGSASIDALSGRLSEGASVSIGLKGSTVSAGPAGLVGYASRYRDISGLPASTARDWALHLAQTAMTIHAAFRPARRAARIAAAAASGSSTPTAATTPLRRMSRADGAGSPVVGGGRTPTAPPLLQPAPSPVSGRAASADDGRQRKKSFLGMFFSSTSTSAASPAPSTPTAATPSRTSARASFSGGGGIRRTNSGTSVDLEQSLAWWNGAERIRRSAASGLGGASRRSSDEDGDYYSYGVSDSEEDDDYDDEDYDEDGEDDEFGYGDDDDDEGGADWRFDERRAGAARAAASDPTSLPALASILSQSMDLVLGTLKTLLVRRLVAELSAGDSQLSQLLARLVSRLQAVYSPATLPHFGVEPREAAEHFKSDVAPLLARAVPLVADIPRSWLSALHDWGATGSFVSPSADFAVVVDGWAAAFRGTLGESAAASATIGSSSGSSGDAFPVKPGSAAPFRASPASASPSLLSALAGACAGSTPLLGRWLAGADQFNPPGLAPLTPQPSAASSSSGGGGAGATSSRRSFSARAGVPPRHLGTPAAAAAASPGGSALPPRTPSGAGAATAASAPGSASSAAGRQHRISSVASTRSRGRSRAESGAGAALSAAAKQAQRINSAWRYVCSLARSLTLSDREVDVVCHEALQQLVYACLGPSVMALYTATHDADDGGLRASYGSLWGLTTTQLELAPELRVDGVGRLAPLVPAHGVVGMYVSSALPLGLPLPPLPVVVAAAASAGAPAAPLASATSPVAPALSSPAPSRLRPSGSGGDGDAGNRGRSSSMHAGGAVKTVVLDLIPEEDPAAGGSGGLASPQSSPALPPIRAAPVMPNAAPLPPPSATAPAAPLPLLPAWPAYARGTFARPAALAAVQPAVDAFALLPSFADPISKMRLLVAVVDILCRCVTLHRQGLSTAVAASATGSAESRAAAAAAAASMIEPSQINADDLLGSLCWVAVHAGLGRLFAEIEFISDLVPQDSLFERGGFVLTTMQAAAMYAKSQDPRDRLRCGHCEGRGKPVVTRCRPCGRRLCADCDGVLHATPATAAHARAPVGHALPSASPALVPAGSPAVGAASGAAVALLALSPALGPAAQPSSFESGRTLPRLRSRSLIVGSGNSANGAAGSSMPDYAAAAAAGGSLTPQLQPVVRITWLAEQRGRGGVSGAATVGKPARPPPVPGAAPRSATAHTAATHSSGIGDDGGGALLHMGAPPMTELAALGVTAAAARRGSHAAGGAGARSASFAAGGGGGGGRTASVDIASKAADLLLQSPRPTRYSSFAEELAARRDSAGHGGGGGGVAPQPRSPARADAVETIKDFDGDDDDELTGVVDAVMEDLQPEGMSQDR